jgi:hypothetical protein
MFPGIPEGLRRVPLKSMFELPLHPRNVSRTPNCLARSSRPAGCDRSHNTPVTVVGGELVLARFNYNARVVRNAASSSLSSEKAPRDSSRETPCTETSTRGMAVRILQPQMATVRIKMARNLPARGILEVG